MLRASMFGSAALISLIAGPSAAQTTMLDVPAAKAMYREAVLGYCAERVTGQALVPHALNPESDDWVPLRPDSLTTGGLSLFSGRVHSQTSVIIDLSPTSTSCFVQVNVPGGGGALLRDALADELTSVFGAAKFQDFPASEAGSGALYGIVSEGSGAVPLFALNRDQSGDVATGVVQIGQRQVP
jgi:hypothetical protein